MSDSQFSEDLKILKDHATAVTGLVLAALGAHLVFVSQGVARAHVLGIVELPAGITWIVGAVVLLAGLAVGVAALRGRLGTSENPTVPARSRRRPSD